MATESNNDPNRDMSQFGFKKELIYRYVTEHPSGGLVVDEVDFYVADIPCRGCGTSQFEWLYPDRSGVLLLCCYCETINGSIAKTLGRARKSYRVTAEEAIRILKTYGWTERDRPIRAIRQEYKRRPQEMVERPRPKE